MAARRLPEWRLACLCSFVSLSLFSLEAAGALSEPGKWTLNIAGNQSQTRFPFRKTLFNHSYIKLKWMKVSCDTPVNLSIAWYLRSSRCYDEFMSVNDNMAAKYFGSLTEQGKGGSGNYILHQYKSIECQKNKTFRQLQVNHYDQPVPLKKATPDIEVQPEPNPKPVSKRNAGNEKKENGKPMIENGKISKTTRVNKDLVLKDSVAKTWEDAPYLFIIEVKKPVINSPENRNWNLICRFSVQQ